MNEEKLRRRRERDRAKRAAETKEEREVRLRKRRETDRAHDRERQREISDVETAEQREERLKIMRDRQRETRVMETDDEREVRLERQRHRQREIRDVETFPQDNPQASHTICYCAVLFQQIFRTILDICNITNFRHFPYNINMLVHTQRSNLIQRHICTTTCLIPESNLPSSRYNSPKPMTSSLTSISLK